MYFFVAKPRLVSQGYSVLILCGLANQQDWCDIVNKAIDLAGKFLQFPAVHMFFASYFRFRLL